MQALIKDIDENKRLLDFRLVDGTEDLEYFNENGYILKEEVEQCYVTGDWYIKGYIPEPTTEELQEQIRQICSQYINNISWRVERYNTQKELGIETSDSAEMYLSILEYMQYLREYDDQSGEWWLSYPEIFDEWRDLDESSVN